MTRRLFSLKGIYEDLCDRYGADDPIVMEMEVEISKREAQAMAVPHVERRKEKSKKYDWSRKAAKGGPTVQTLH
jgi:hypothetical protein